MENKYCVIITTTDTIDEKNKLINILISLIRK